jgi:MYXO-CTERM domain-containing protein
MPLKCSHPCVALVVALGVLGVAATAHAEKSLVVQKTTGNIIASGAGPAAAMQMNALGHDATLLESTEPILPDDLASYSQVYLIGLAGIAQPELLVDYVHGGGHLYVTGERPGNESLNLFVQDQILAQVLDAAQELQVGTGIEGGGREAYELVALGGDKAELALHPNRLTQMMVGDPGVIGGVAASNVFAHDDDGNAIGALWTADDLVQGDGCVMLVMDINWWNVMGEGGPQTQEEAAPVIENVIEFMSSCGDHGGGDSSSSGAADEGSGGSSSTVASSAGESASEGEDDTSSTGHQGGNTSSDDDGSSGDGGAGIGTGDDAGCGCTSGSTPGGLAGTVSLVAIAALRRRRRGLIAVGCDDGRPRLCSTTAMSHAVRRR